MLPSSRIKNIYLKTEIKKIKSTMLTIAPRPGLTITTKSTPLLSSKTTSLPTTTSMSPITTTLSPEIDMLPTPTINPTMSKPPKHLPSPPSNPIPPNQRNRSRVRLSSLNKIKRYKFPNPISWCKNRNMPTPTATKGVIKLILRKPWIRKKILLKPISTIRTISIQIILLKSMILLVMSS